MCVHSHRAVGNAWYGFSSATHTKELSIEVSHCTLSSAIKHLCIYLEKYGIFVTHAGHWVNDLLLLVKYGVFFLPIVAFFFCRKWSLAWKCSMLDEQSICMGSSLGRQQCGFLICMVFDANICASCDCLVLPPFINISLFRNFKWTTTYRCM